MERITESEEKSRDIDVDHSEKETGIAENTTKDMDLRGADESGGEGDPDDLDFGDLDPADLGFTDPSFGDPEERPASNEEKAEEDYPGSDSDGPSADDEEAAAKTDAEKTAAAKPDTEEAAEKSDTEETTTAVKPDTEETTAAVKSDAAQEETTAETEKSAAQPPSEEPDMDADVKIRRKRKKRPAPASKGRAAASAIEDEDDYGEADYDEDDYDDPDEEEIEEERRSQKIWLAFLLVSLIVFGLIGGVFYGCTVKNVYVKGNTLYTSEEIAERVISDDSQLRHNTVFLTLLYHTPFAPKIPFEEKVEVTPNSYDTITITVKDKKLAGYIPYGGRNIYFSADGITLENSPLTVKGVTYVTGVTLNEAEIGMPLSAENPEGFALILNALKILRKYEIESESLVLTQSGSVTMFLGDVRVILGRSDYELKIAKIAQILPYLEGRKGTIDLTNYTSSDQNIILK